MKAKQFFKTALMHNIMRHRQHRRFMHNLGMQARHFGPGRSLLVMGAIALAGRFLQKRRQAAHRMELPSVQSGTDNF